MHKLLFEDEDEVIDLKTSTKWLTKGNISAQHEGMITKLQDRNLYFGSSNIKCVCGHANKSVEYLATRCGRLLNSDYKRRHDEVVRCLHFQYTKKYGLNKKKRLKNYQVEKVVSNKRVKIKSDIPILTELQIECNKPDLMIHDLMKKKITLVEVGITNKTILVATEVEKGRKYQILANELKCLHPGTEVEIIPVVMTWDGLVTKNFKKYMNKLDVNDKLIGYMQSTVLKKTCETILFDGKRRNDWLEEEISEAMEQLESNLDATEEE